LKPILPGRFARTVAALHVGITSVKEEFQTTTLPENLKAITTSVVGTVFKRVTNQVLEPKTPSGTIEAGHNGEPLLHFDHQDPAILGTVAELAGASRDEIEAAVKHRIQAILDGIMEGKNEASDKNFFDVGNLRLSGFLQAMFEGEEQSISFK
jgi:hypothetical protein